MPAKGRDGLAAGGPLRRVTRAGPFDPAVDITLLPVLFVSIRRIALLAGDPFRRVLRTPRRWPDITGLALVVGKLLFAGPCIPAVLDIGGTELGKIGIAHAALLVGRGSRLHPVFSGRCLRDVDTRRDGYFTGLPRGARRRFRGKKNATERAPDTQTSFIKGDCNDDEGSRGSVVQRDIHEVEVARRHTGAALLRGPALMRTCIALCRLAPALIGLTLPAFANDNVPPTKTTPSPTVTLPVVVVSATCSPQQAFELPASIDAVSLQRIDADNASINPSEALRAVPGVLARDRQNAAQDEQISIRGFGARTTFGVRGVRLYVDGIPATMPDGQGQLSNFSLGAADRIEVLRGPFSALYGNSSGGVIQLFTADGTDPPQWRAMFGTGPYAGQRVELGTRGLVGNLDYNVDLSRLVSEGFRRNSRSERDNGNVKLSFSLGEHDTLTVLANSVLVPHAQDPKGLTRQEYLRDPRQAAPSALRYNTRKSVRQNQAGTIFDHDSGDGTQWRVLAYYGERAVQQFLSVPTSAQSSPLSAGGVIDLDGRYGGTDARWSWNGQLADRPFSLVLGSSWDRQDQQRRGYENFLGDRLGVVGALRRNERNVVFDIEEYAQARWQLAPRWSLTGGLRHSSVHFDVGDQYVTTANPDDSGRRTYAATSPVAGVLFRAGRDWHVYASWGRGFETPTFNELGYRSDGGSGLNLGLQAARSDNVELGSKWRWGTGNSVDMALFQADTRDELAVDTNVDGRTTYRNRGNARRRGAEAEIKLSLAPRWQLQAAYTWLDARFAQAVDGATGVRIPGVPRSAFDASVRWGGARGWHARLQLSAIGAVAANDANSAQATGYALVDASVGYVIDDAQMEIAPFLRLDNLFDRRYIGSVIVNESTSRYFEPGPGRTLYLGCRLTFR